MRGAKLVDYRLIIEPALVWRPWSRGQYSPKMLAVAESGFRPDSPLSRTAELRCRGSAGLTLESVVVTIDDSAGERSMRLTSDLSAAER